MDEMCPGFYSEADATLLPTASQQNMEFEGENLMAHPYKVLEPTDLRPVVQSALIRGGQIHWILLTHSLSLSSL